MRDIRYALRALGRQPLFAAAAVLTLAVGIGANTAVFSVLFQTLLKPLPYADPERLVFVWNSYPLTGLPQASVAIPDYLDRREQAPAIIDATLFAQRSVSLAEGGSPEQVRALRVTPSFFSTLGRGPLLGGPFTDQHDHPGADQFVILTFGLWRARFGADPSIVGRDLRVDGVAHRVIGVLAADFELPARDISLLVPFSFTAEDRSDASRGNEYSAMIARLAPGATRDELHSQMSAIAARVAARLPERRGFIETSGFTGSSVPIRDQLVGDLRRPLLVLQAAVVLVLLIACVNVANLQLMRATGRQREVAIRSAIGAGRWHLVRQMLTEGLVLSALGGAAALLVGNAGVRALVALVSARLPGGLEPSLHPPVLAFTLFVACVTGAIFGLVPASSLLGTAVDARLRSDGGRSSPTRLAGRARATLVVAEVALAVMLLVGAGLMVRTLAHLREVDPGFTPANVLTAQMALPAARYPDPRARLAFWAGLLQEVSGIPGVVGSGLTSNVPFNGMVSSGSYRIVGYTPPEGQPSPHGRQEIVGGDYFTAMHIPLVRGRLFEDADDIDGPPVVIIDEYLVTRYFRDTDPIGRQIQRGGPGSTPFTVIGVVGTINSIELGQPVEKERLYYSVRQLPRASMALVIKTGLDPMALVSAVRSAVQRVDPEQPIADVRTMDQWIDQSLQTRQAPAVLLTFFGAVALVLAGIGIYGVLAFGVAQRSREFGIRQALGADRRAILRMVLGQGVRTAGVGVVVGLSGAMGATRLLESQLFGVGPRDPMVFGGAAVILLAVAVLACYLPARTTTLIDPVAALRDG